MIEETREIRVLDRVFLPHSLGSFYTMICEFISYNLSDSTGPQSSFSTETHLFPIATTVQIYSP
jgi:hypothetical protein